MHDTELVRTRHEALLDDVRGRRSTRTEVRPRAGRRMWRRRAAR
jgi:hypothetical protein